MNCGVVQIAIVLLNFVIRLFAGLFNMVFKTTKEERITIAFMGLIWFVYACLSKPPYTTLDVIVCFSPIALIYYWGGVNNG